MIPHIVFLLIACTIRGVPATGCDRAPEAVAQYRADAERVPAAHWALVREIQLVPDTSGRAWKSGLIQLADNGRPGVLWHEVGHLVSWEGTGYRYDSWRYYLWTDDGPRGDPPSRYAHTGPGEDFAESYRAWLRGDLQQLSPGRYDMLAMLLW